MLRKDLFIIFVVSAALGNTEAADNAYKVVTKTVSLGTYTPQDIAVFRGVEMSTRIMADLKSLLEAAKKDGLTLKVVSGYRSYEYQKIVFNRWKEQEKQKNPKLTDKAATEIANTYSARPGHSEHQLGTAVDILSSENNYKFSLNPELKYVGWLEKNASRFNFKISYPKGGTEYVYEPWHLRWYPPQTR
jgi:LAS superfamily LD-carboxypeptidase LdcB